MIIKILTSIGTNLSKSFNIYGDNPKYYINGIPMVGTSTTNVSGDYTVTSDDDVIRVDALGGAVNITLPSAADINGRVFIVKKIDETVNNVVIIGTIDGNASVTLNTTNRPSLSVRSNGTDWDII